MTQWLLCCCWTWSSTTELWLPSNINLTALSRSTWPLQKYEVVWTSAVTWAFTLRALIKVQADCGWIYTVAGRVSGELWPCPSASIIPAHSGKHQHQLLHKYRPRDRHRRPKWITGLLRDNTEHSFEPRYHQIVSDRVKIHCTYWTFHTV